MYAMGTPAHHQQGSDGAMEKKKKKEEKDREKHDKDKEKVGLCNSLEKKSLGEEEANETRSLLVFIQPKKKSASAYQVFCKEYRVNITAEQPGLGTPFDGNCPLMCMLKVRMNGCVSAPTVFGELSKKLGEVWKRMPEKDKLVSSCVHFS